MPWNEPGSNNKNPWGKSTSSNSELDKILSFFRKKNDNSPGFPLWIIVVAALAFYAFRGFYKVDEGYESIEFRFGKYTQKVGSGPHFIFWPIESKVLVNAKKIRTVEIGFRKDTGTVEGSVRQEAQMLTQDENIADVSMAVQYNINNVEQLLFNVGSVEREGVLENVVRGATESALREVVGSMLLDNLLNKKREEVSIRTKVILQTILDKYQTGIQVSKVVLQAALPPVEVREAFENVNKAEQLEQQLIKESKAYTEKVVLSAQGSAARVLTEADAYKTAKIAAAEGETQRFTQLLYEYKKAPEVTRKRLYLETMEAVLTDSKVVMVDQKSSNSLLYLPIDKLINENKTSTSNVQKTTTITTTPINTNRSDNNSVIRRGR